MELVEREGLDDKDVEVEISSDLDRAKELARALSIDDVKSGQWFVALLQRVFAAYDRNVRSEYFEQKYPGLDRDEIADILISVTVRYATIAGALTGAATTANMVVTLGSAGMTAGLMVGAIGAEMLYLARIQMKLVLDLSVVYDLQLDPEDPEDMLMVFGYALGVAPSEMLGKGLVVAAGGGAKYAVRKYISKGSLKFIQDLGRRIGIRILQRTIIKYTVPVASAVMGSCYNYTTTKSLGKIAKAHLRNRGKVTDELRQLVSRQHTYDLAFPAAAMYMAQVDGQFSAKEKEFYLALLSRMSFEEHSRAEFQKLLADEDTVLAAIAGLDDSEVRSCLLEALVLMAIYDGELVQAERDFLMATATQLAVPLNIDEVEERAMDYRVAVEKGLLQRTGDVAKETTSRAADLVGQAIGGARESARAAGQRAADRVGAVLQRRGDDGEKVDAGGLAKVCPACGATAPADFRFCPNCGQSLATEKECLACNERMPVGFSFCPQCGAKQG